MADPRDPLVIAHPTHHSRRLMAPEARGTALLRIAGLFLVGQGLSALILALTLGQYSWLRVWLHGLAGPFVVVEGVTRFPYSPWWQIIGYLLLTMAILIAPFAMLRVPGRRGVIGSVVGVVAWIFFGLLQSVHHL